MELNLPLIVIGLLCLAVGIGLVVARSRIARANASVLRGTLGKLGGRVASGSPAKSIAGAGSIGILMGVVAIIGGFFGH